MWCPVTSPAHGRPSNVSTNPATGARLARLSHAGQPEIDAAVAAAGRAGRRWAALGGHGRARYLYALARMVQKHARLFAVLEALDNKMHKNGLVLYVLYAEFFNTDKEQCGLDQDWNLIPFGRALPLTRERRERFNSLVESTNSVLRDAIKEVQRAKKIKYRVRAVDWNDWARHGVRGQYCYPGTNGFDPIDFPKRQLITVITWKSLLRSGCNKA